MHYITKNPVAGQFIFIILNSIHWLFIMTIFVEGIVGFEIGFSVNTPIFVFLILLFLVSTIRYLYDVNRNKENDVILLFFTLINTLILVFNLILWWDFADGRTDIVI